MTGTLQELPPEPASTLGAPLATRPGGTTVRSVGVTSASMCRKGTPPHSHSLRASHARTVIARRWRCWSNDQPNQYSLCRPGVRGRTSRCVARDAPSIGGGGICWGDSKESAGRSGQRCRVTLGEAGSMERISAPANINAGDEAWSECSFAADLGVRPHYRLWRGLLLYALRRCFRVRS
jgi:hypothetical protein